MMVNLTLRRRLASGLVAAVAALGLVALGPVGPARGADTVDQITGNGETDSKVTVRWDKGLLGPDNKTVVKPRDPDSAYKFMYDDFKNLEVSVGQTENLVHQAVRVSWKGGKATGAGGAFLSNYLQIMECYGDTDAGPNPENCQFGSDGLRATNAGSQSAVSRGGQVCSGGTPSADKPLTLADGSSPANGCDPGEDKGAPGYSHQDPGAENSFFVPFIPVKTTDPLFKPIDWPYNKFNSNEIQLAETRADGTGEVFFNTLTRREASGLGCGEVLTNGKPRGCWLVIVPRGEYMANGWKLGTDDQGYVMQGSPLGAGSWAQRIQIHLGYSPVEPNCPIGSAKERQTQGTEVVSRAVYSWQLALNTAANCSKLYGFASTPEASNTAELTNSFSETGLAFTTVNIGSEATRSGSTPPALPPIVYAPVAVSALTFGFHVNLAPGGYRTAPVKMTPRLLAKALTQSYRNDLVDVDSNGGAGPEWARKNPRLMTQDPEFIKVNPDVGQRGGAELMTPQLTAEHSGILRQVWAWILTDESARAWLTGTADENGMVVNPAYKDLNLAGAGPIDSFPRVNQCYRTPQSEEPERGKCTLDQIPYMENFDESASRVRGAANPDGVSWNPNARSPSGTPGWWVVDQPVQFPGSIFMWGVMDSASLANYGVVPAQLCKGDGTGCVSPTVASVTAAFSGIVIAPDQVPQVDPAKVMAGAYPLTSITYAAVRLNQERDALADYAAFIKFAVNEGQTPGVDPGQLPHGYLPLPQPLREASTQIADLLANLPSPTATTPDNGGSGNGNGGGGGGSGGGGGNTGTVPNPGARPVASSSSAGAFTTTSASAVPAALSTPHTAVGLVRWALVVVLTAGLVGAVGGPLLRLGLSRRLPP
ncbi:hypothetical protein [Dactylosporangium sp. CA-139066]|uniref:hypothetical protein n=1 Tax=Dactylosporangium sp. CA-139066 TaxID=3239930 RepID=UPI003D8D0D95